MHLVIRNIKVVGNPGNFPFPTGVKAKACCGGCASGKKKCGGHGQLGDPSAEEDGVPTCPTGQYPVRNTAGVFVCAPSSCPSGQHVGWSTNGLVAGCFPNSPGETPPVQHPNNAACMLPPVAGQSAIDRIGHYVNNVCVRGRYVPPAVQYADGAPCNAPRVVGGQLGSVSTPGHYRNNVCVPDAVNNQPPPGGDGLLDGLLDGDVSVLGFEIPKTYLLIGGGIAAVGLYFYSSSGSTSRSR